MAKALCPECDELVPIRDTGIAQSKRHSSRWWQIALHPDKREPAKLCDGSGALV